MSKADARKVRVEVEGDVAFIVIDNPPINAGSHAVRQVLLAAIAEVSDMTGLAGVVLIGAGNWFMTGSDIREFGAPLDEPQLPSVIRALEACPVPVVAAIAGAALGGGYELALGCDARIASAEAVVGLPETTLGIIPGAGGTQRLPRLIGRAKAIELICGGTRVKAAEAARLGMVDALATADLRAEAAALVRSMSGKLRVTDRSLPPEDAAAVTAARAAALKAGRGRPHIAAAIAAIEMCGTVPVAEGLTRERAVFTELRTGREATALRHLFFAERAAAKVPDLADVTARPVARVGIVGGGTMGSGIAVAMLDAGKMVTLYELNPDALEAARGRVGKSLQTRMDRGRMTAEARDAALAKVTFSTVLEDLGQADVVIEAVFEDMGVKRVLFADLARVTRPDAVLATNTSYLSVTEIAQASGQPASVAGMHFFSPADVMKLVEVVRHPAVDREALATLMELAKAAKKLPILCNDAFGFIGNRIYAAYRRQCEFMLEEGALPEQVDAALETFGFAMGPFAVQDMSGLDIAWRMRQATAASRDPAARYVKIADTLCEMGRLGRKTGAGYYLYDAAGKRAVDPVVTGVVEAASAAAGVTRRPFAEAEIVERALAAMASEAALLIAEGVANAPSDVDLVLTNGYGFPRYEGGPLFWAQHQPKADLEAAFARLQAKGGSAFRLGPITALRQN